MKTKQITILLPVYNGERYLASALDSIRKQTFENFVCLILDDGSSDGTADISRRAVESDERFRYIGFSNRGLVTTLNEGLSLVDTEWIARLDADDIMVSNRLERQLAFAQENPHLSVAASYVKYIDDVGRIFGEGRSRFISTEVVQEALREGDLIGLHHPSVLARTSAMRRMNGYREEAWLAEDTDLWTRMAEHGMEILVQREFLTYYRVHGSSVSRAKMRTQNEIVAWLKCCLDCRKQNRTEPTWQEFQKDQADQPWFVRMDRWRRECAKCLYKDATLSFARQKFMRCGFQLLAASTLQPSHVWKQIRGRKIIK
ncbi:MAG: glycosyltransferase family 2 protein [Anaerorhabdus sp.]|uniref:glycosyltransferase family 2 protein n=1 Tax=Anaerorhabdus sp. TaxID=1872524 RepID=UPI003A89A749